MNAKAYQIATGVISIAASFYAGSLSGQSLERYWWHGVGGLFGLWSVLESRQSIKEQVEDDTLEDADQQIFLGKVSNRVRLETMPPTPQQHPEFITQNQLAPVQDSPAADSTPQIIPHSSKSDLLDGLVRDLKSIILSAIPGTTKTTLVLAYLSRLYELFPQAKVYVACAKNDSFLGLNQLGQVKVCDTAEQLLEQTTQVGDILKKRKNTSEKDRKFKDKPVVFLFDDGTYLLNLIKQSPKLFKKFKELMCFIGTVGREFNVKYFGSVHSLNLDQLGVEASDIRDCLNVCSLGFISIDAKGNTAGGYDSLYSVINRKEIVVKEDRKYLLSELSTLIQQSQNESRPIFFTTLGTEATLSLLTDLRALASRPLPIAIIDEDEYKESEPITYTEPVEGREGKSDVQKRILENLVKVEIIDDIQAKLPDHLWLICQYSQQKGWITARDLCRNKSYFKSVPAEQVKGYLRELIARHVGVIRGSDDNPEWCFCPGD
ncbi:MAG: hypothetical protein AAFO04_05420 [Cyanobacteria bacterium J06592_8]